MDKHTPQLLVLLKRLWVDYVRRYRKMLAGGALLLVFSSASTSLQPLLIQEAFDKIFKDKDLVALMAIPSMIVVVFVFQAITLYASTQIMGRVGNAIMADLRKDLLTHIMENELDFYSRNDSGALMSRMLSEVIHISAAITNFFNAWCRQVITAGGLFAVMLYQSVELTLISLAVFIFAAYPLRRIAVRLKKLSVQVNDVTGNLSSRLIESLAGIRTVKSFRKEAFEIEKISGYVNDIRTYSNRTNQIATITVPMLQVLSGGAIAFVIWFGGQELIAGRMTEGNLVAFIASLMMFSRPMRSLSSAGATMVKGLVAAERFYDIVHTQSPSRNRDQGISLQVTAGRIVFEDTGFAYPGGAEALSGVSFVAEAGKKTALVGHSGSGKSTIFNLLMKFYEPTQGRVLIDGQRLSEASINSVRAQTALVSQDVFIFDATAMENIGYGREGASEEDIIAAARAAYCHEFISQLPQGYHTKLGFAGATLSGGQKQRISIARAFLRNAPILLLDEATSALDPRTEMDIQESLDRLCKGRTTLVIAHRLSTVSNSDQMVLLREGRVAAMGTHAELLAESPLYRNHFGI